MNETWWNSLEEKISYKAKDRKWLHMAVTHSSYRKRNPQEVEGDYERLEFVGDAVLDLVVARMLFEQFPQDDEGGLSRKRASLVNEDSLYNLAMRLQLNDYLLLDEAEERQGLRYNKRLVASLLEGLIGAIYMDSNFARAEAWVEDIYKNHSAKDFQEHDFVKDFKTRFQELVQEKLKVTPVYETLESLGPDHLRQFRVQVLVNGEVQGEGMGESKKAAAQSAAEAALQKWEEKV